MIPEELNNGGEDFSEINEAFVQAMRQYGYLFPDTEEELEIFKTKLQSVKLEIPKDFQDPLEILKRGKVQNLTAFDTSEDTIIEENMAMAAREGKELNQEMIEKMNKDRKQAEDKQNDSK